jgi:hypothetical protein
LKEEALDLNLVENSLWKRLCTCRKTDHVMMIMMMITNDCRSEVFFSFRCQRRKNWGGCVKFTTEKGNKNYDTLCMKFIFFIHNLVVKSVC